MIATHEPFAPKAQEELFFKNSISKQRKILYVKLHFSLLNIQFFGFGQNFRKMVARNLILGARAAVYRGDPVLFGAGRAEDGRRTEQRMAGGRKDGRRRGGFKIEI